MPQQEIDLDRQTLPRAVVHPVLMRLKPIGIFPAALLLYRRLVTITAANRNRDGNGRR
jgi:hypothetical protein